MKMNLQTAMKSSLASIFTFFVSLVIGSAPGHCTTYQVFDLGGYFFGGGGINDSGQVAGTFTVSETRQAVVTSKNSPIKGLGTLPGGSLSIGKDINNHRSSAEGINNHGQVVGWSDHSGDDGSRWKTFRLVLCVVFRDRKILIGNSNRMLEMSKKIGAEACADGV